MKSIVERNNVKITGKGSKVILFAHGFGCDQHSWDFIVDEFTENYKVILFDYVGAGKSDLKSYNSEKYGSLDGYAQDILDICGELGLKNIIFVGHSVSAMIGLLAANKEPSYFEKLVFVGPSPRYLNEPGYIGGFERSDLDSLFEFMDNNYLGWSESLGPAIIGNPERPELGKFMSNSFCSTDPDIAKEFAKVTFFSDNRADLGKLTIPSLTLQCQEDIIAPVPVGQYVHNHVGNNLLVMLKAKGHCPHISEPAETVAAIKAFI
ncbi:MAG: alpha/beta hydrolase [Bacteroidota bacterium]|nr:alpha/beta hydrolase [Bacteroidota bacterium]